MSFAAICTNIIIYMNPQFQTSRSPGQSPLGPFYNPQKEVPNPNNPTLYQTPPLLNSPFLPNSNSKSYVARSNIMEGGKPGNNTSAYFKNPNDPNYQPNKFVSTSPTNMYPNTSYNGFPGGFPGKSSTEMMKSSIKESIATTEGNYGYPTQQPEKVGVTSNANINTPSRRAPRMSEPHQFNSDPPELKTKNEAMSMSDSPVLQKKFRDQRDPEVQFFKNRNGATKGPEEKEDGKGQNWGKKTFGKRKPFTVNDFKKIKDLGTGKYGQVSLVQERASGFVCALKVIEKKLIRDEEIIEQFIRELKIQQYLNHPNIIKMYGFFDDQSHIFIILEVGTGGQLLHQFKKSQPVPQAKLAPIMKQVCEAVNEIHSLRIIHRDIKPENIVLHDNVVKLCDFGWSVYLDNSLRTTFCGTPLYVCPEILKGKEYDEKIDIWSLGIMMYEMLVGQNPFKITRQQELIKIVKDQIAIPTYVFVSREARDFLDKCLKKNPSDRVGIKQLLNHDFLIKNQEKGDKKVAF